MLVNKSFQLYYALKTLLHADGHKRNTPDHCYTPLKNSYRVKSLPTFGRSAHLAGIEVCKQNSTNDASDLRLGNGQTNQRLQCTLQDADSSMFKDTAINVTEDINEQSTESNYRSLQKHIGLYNYMCQLNSTGNREEGLEKI